jgi:hypothetical protein
VWLDRRRHELLRLAATVDVRRVEERDAHLDALVDDRLGAGSVDTPAKVVASESDDGHLQAGVAEVSILHVFRDPLLGVGRRCKKASAL